MYLSEESFDCEYINIAFDICMNQGATGRSTKEQDDFQELIEDEHFLIHNLLVFGTRHVQDKGGCLKSLDDIVCCLEQSYLGDFICLMAYETCFFLSALQNFSDTVIREDFTEEVYRLSSKRAVPAIKISEYIWNHCEEDITIEQIADTLGYSKRSIQRLLSDYYSVGYSVLLTHYRIAKLKIALQNGTDTLNSFSEKCGYNDTRVLSRNFIKITGMTVAEFKQNLKAHKET
ncbi:MAG: helix-turn-helix transcriptional regulator [Lachnospiraceae bacterium]|nr:helix-turn-helix transcriptional regulator [Lachnospiraceae bacterium]